MKKKLIKYLLAIFILIGASATSYTQTRVYVKVRPTIVATVKPTPPHPNYVWIDDEWTVKNGVYVQAPGYWAAPRAGFVWVPGHWSSEAKGDYWIPGHWKKV